MLEYTRFYKGVACSYKYIQYGSTNYYRWTPMIYLVKAGNGVLKKLPAHGDVMNTFDDAILKMRPVKGGNYLWLLAGGPI